MAIEMKNMQKNKQKNTMWVKEYHGMKEKHQTNV